MVSKSQQQNVNASIFILNKTKPKKLLRRYDGRSFQVDVQKNTSNKYKGNEKNAAFQILQKVKIQRMIRSKINEEKVQSAAQRSTWPSSDQATLHQAKPKFLTDLRSSLSLFFRFSDP